MGLTVNNLERNVYTTTLKHHKDYSPFDMCLVRNKEMNNLLSIANSSQLKISSKSGQTITVNNLPNYHRFDESNWVAMLCDEDKTSSPDGDGGDYLYYGFATINRFQKTITLTVDLTQWEVGDNLVLYNPFVNYEFVGDQTVTPSWPVSGAPSWRDNTTSGSSVWLGLDGVYRQLINGGSGGTIFTTIGYAVASSISGPWTVQNGDDAIITAANLLDCSGTIYAAGSVIRLEDNNNAVLVIYADLGGIASIRIMLFDDDFTTVTFTDKIFEPGYHLSGGGIEYFGGYFHLLYYHRPGDLESWELRAAKCSTIDGAFVDYHSNILTGTGAVDAATWKDHIDAPSIIKTKNKVFGLVGGTGYASVSGSKGNRQYCLLNFNHNTQTWSANRLGPVIINPMYWNNLGADYAWASDHCGGNPGLFRDTDGQYYTSISMRGSNYQQTLLRLKIKES